MTTLKASLLSSAAAFLICWIQLAHAFSKFTSEDANFIFPQFGVNQDLLPPPGHRAIVQLYATGYQHYIYNGTSWVLTNATARLFNARMEEVAVHFYLPNRVSKGGQPSWETIYPRSLVTGRPIATQTSDNNIALVLLQATHEEGDPELFGRVTYIQRLYTQNGLPPNSPAKKINGRNSSPYTAFYVYYTKM